MTGYPKVLGHITHRHTLSGCSSTEVQN